jgi:hypothetical protein
VATDLATTASVGAGWARPRERRRSERLDTRLRIDYCRLAHCDGAATLRRSRRALATNVSATGLVLTDAGELEVGHLLHIAMRLPDVPGNAITCDARVVRISGAPETSAACRILQISHWDSQRLAEFVARCARA